jgi:hypothetical protein
MMLVVRNREGTILGLASRNEDATRIGDQSGSEFIIECIEDQTTISEVYRDYYKTRSV